MAVQHSAAPPATPRSGTLLYKWVPAAIFRKGEALKTPSGQRAVAWYYSRGFTLSCCLRQLSSGRFPVRGYGEGRPSEGGGSLVLAGFAGVIWGGSGALPGF